jgi:anti-anti-sigma factor
MAGPIQELGWSHTLVLTGRLDDSTAAELQDEIECLCQEGVKHLTLDLRGLEELDTDALSAIASSSSDCTRRGHGFAVIAGSPATRRALADAGVSEALLRVAGDPPATRPAAAMAIATDRDLATSTVHAL